MIYENFKYHSVTKCIRQSHFPTAPGHPYACWRKPFLFRTEHPLLCLCSSPACLSSPVCSVIVAPQANCHTVKLPPPLCLARLGVLSSKQLCLQKSVGIQEHTADWCAESWVRKSLVPSWLFVLLTSVLAQPLPLQPFGTSVSSSRSLLVLMSCIAAVSSVIPLFWLSFLSVNNDSPVPHLCWKQSFL